jgi:hypothetical protein
MADDPPADAPPSAPIDAPAPAPAAVPAPAPAPAPAESPAPPAPTAPLASGVRLGLELGFARANSPRGDVLTQGSPSYLPIGADVSLRTSEKVLLGLHGHAALASRDDCGSLDSCTARSYGVGAHIETPFATTSSNVLPWFRYGVGWEMLYRSGVLGDSGGHAYRSAIDMLDARVGVDFVLQRLGEGRSVRLGPYAGMVAGVMTSQDGSFGYPGQPRQSLDSSGGNGHLWWVIGARGTIDP